MLHTGSGVTCPACQSAYRDFRRGEQCWRCGSLPRHRQITLLLDRRPELLRPGMRILHIAPEEAVVQLLPGDCDYVAGDLDPGRGMVRVDVTDMEFDAESFDVVLCNHVMEHVSDDRTAMAEIHRVLRPDGWAILMTPILVDVTDEDPAVTDPGERARRWGQADHVRRYGPDYATRLEAARLRVEVIDDFAADDVLRYRLENSSGKVEPLFLAHRRE